MQPKQNIPIPRDDNNVSENFGSHEDEKFKLKEYDIKRESQ